MESSFSSIIRVLHFSRTDIEKQSSMNKPAGSQSTVLGQPDSNRGFISSKDRVSVSIKCQDTGHKAPRKLHLCPGENRKI